MDKVGLSAGVVLACAYSWAAGQTAWETLNDSESTSTCGIVNAVSAATGSPIQFVILSDTAQLMMVTRGDTILTTTVVSADNFFVFDNGEPKGVIEFANDGDGFRTLWWVSLEGAVVEVDAFTGEAFAGTRFPEEFVDVPCDACPFVDLPPPGRCGLSPDTGGLSLSDIVVNACGSGFGGVGMVLMAVCGFVALRCVRV